MKKLSLFCSMFLLLFAAFAYADLSHLNTLRFNPDQAHISVEKDTSLLKFAGVAFITEYGKKAYYKNFGFKKPTVICSSSQYPSTSAPEHCGYSNSCTDSNGITRYLCKKCQDGYTVKNNVCAPNPCLGYDFDDCEIEHCAYLENGDCHKAVESCQKGEVKVYKCSECARGYEIDSVGGCSSILCTYKDYPYTTRPTICSGTPLLCYSGEDTYYGCSDCKSGYIKFGGWCMNAGACDDSYKESCPPQAICSVCQTGETIKYKPTSCERGYVLNYAGTACRTASAVGFVVTTTDASQGITIQTTGSASIDWGDGKTDDVTGNAKSTSHTFATAGAYGVYVTGTPTAFRISIGQTYVTKLLDISLPSITSYANAFSGCTNMTGDLTDMTFPSGLINGYYMFYNCSKLTGSIPALPSSLTNGENMFRGCSGLTGFAFSAFPSSLTNGKAMFRGCSGLTGTIPALPSGLTSGYYMFEGCSSLTGTIPELPSGLTNGKYMFYNCRGLTGFGFSAFPSGLTNGYRMFSGCSGLTGTIPALPSGLGNGQAMFEGCSSLTGTIPALPSGLTNGGYMFYNCRGLTGRCPTKPDALTTVTSMYQSTGVCCNYGNAPSTCN